VSNSENNIKVWDPVIRIGHWTLVIAFFTAYFTEDDFLTLHVWAGYVIGAVVCFRLVWGFIGSRHAKFSNFVRSPAAAFKYVLSLVRNQSKRYIGHNPAGGIMILLLLIVLFGTVFSGVVLYGMEEGAGPLAAWVSAFADSEDLWEEAHEILSNLTLLLVVMHIAGVLLSGRAHKEFLVKAMLTGQKKAHE
jgi:cytochrome b